MPAIAYQRFNSSLSPLDAPVGSRPVVPPPAVFPNNYGSAFFSAAMSPLWLASNTCPARTERHPANFSSDLTRSASVAAFSSSISLARALADSIDFPALAICPFNSAFFLLRSASGARYSASALVTMSATSPAASSPLEPTPSICCASCYSDCSLTCAVSPWRPCHSTPASCAPSSSLSTTGPALPIRRAKQKNACTQNLPVQGAGASRAGSGSVSGSLRLLERFQTRQPSLQTRRYRIYRVSYRSYALSNRWRSACGHFRISPCLLPF